MTNCSLLTIGVLAVGLIVTGGAADETQPAAKCRVCETECAGCPSDPSCEEACPADGTLSTLLQLRRLFGDPLAGTALAGSDCCEEDGFAAALSQVAEQKQAVERPYGGVAYTNDYYPPAILPAPTPVMPYPYVQAHPMPAVKTLRASARQLEAVASDLEEIGKYEEADGLREVVARLRQEARGAAAVSAHRAPGAGY